MTAETETLRADARRNREQIIAAAKKIFLESGPDVPMEEIARAAGVGVGTLYRRFPDREALIRGVARHNFEVVLTDMRKAAAEGPTAWEAIVRLLSRSLELRLSVQLALTSPMAWEVIRTDQKTREFRDSILAVLDELVRAAQEEGSLRDDVGAGDVFVLCTMLLRPTKGDRRQWSEMALERCLAIILDGLRARPASRLPGQAITGKDLLGQ